MSLADIWLFTEALFTSAYVRFSLSFMPFKQVAEWLGSTTELPANCYADDAQSIASIRNVQRALALCHKYAFWKTECYTLALTGKILLKRRDLSSTLYIGFRKNQSGELTGHAWLISHGLCVAGNMDLSQFAVHSSFS